MALQITTAAPAPVSNNLQDERAPVVVDAYEPDARALGWLARLGRKPAVALKELQNDQDQGIRQLGPMGQLGECEGSAGILGRHRCALARRWNRAPRAAYEKAVRAEVLQHEGTELVDYASGWLFQTLVLLAQNSDRIKAVHIIDPQYFGVDGASVVLDFTQAAQRFVPDIEVRFYENAEDFSKHKPATALPRLVVSADAVDYAPRGVDFGTLDRDLASLRGENGVSLQLNMINVGRRSAPCLLRMGPEAPHLRHPWREQPSGGAHARLARERSCVLM